jgi:hypothetical protein
MPIRTRRGIAAMIAIAVVVLASAWIRQPGLTEGRFASHDVGGILYNAMLLHAGALPYVDSVEFKAPGSFYLATVLAGPEGRDIAAFQVAANLTALASLVLLAVLAWRLWGASAAVVAAIVFALHDANLDSMDANYVTWALLPQIAAMLVAFVADDRRRGQSVSARNVALTWFASGVLAAFATLCKQPSGIVLVAATFHAFAGGPRRDHRAALWVIAGFVAGHLPVALHYLARGHLGDLLAGYIGNPWGLAYVGHHLETPLWEAAREGVLATAYFVALPLVLVAYAVTAERRERAEPHRAVVATLIVWILAALVGAAVGLRFYKGYFLAALPPLVLLGVAPWGLCGANVWRRGFVRFVTAPVLVVLVARAATIMAATREDRARPHDDGARRIAAYIAAQTHADDRIWVWGWHLWGVFAYSGRLSASPIYKTPGLLTRFEDDSWRRQASPLVFEPDSPYVPILLADLSTNRPAFIVLGGSVPRDDFTELRRFIADNYVRDRRLAIGRAEIWRRRDHVPPP